MYGATMLKDVLWGKPTSKVMAKNLQNVPVFRKGKYEINYGINLVLYLIHMLWNRHITPQRFEEILLRLVELGLVRPETIKFGEVQRITPDGRSAVSRADLKITIQKRKPSPKKSTSSHRFCRLSVCV